MKARALVALACVACATLGASAAAAQPAPGAVYVRGGVGFATQSMGDWRDFIESLKQAFPEWTNIKTAFEPGAEVGYVVHPLFSVGVRVAHQRGTSNNSYGDLELTQSQRLAMSMTTWTGTATLWLPTLPGFYIGAEAGRGQGAIDYEAHVHHASDPSSDRDQTGAWNGSKFVGGVFVGFQQRLGEHGFWYYHGGWRRADLGVMNGHIDDLQYGRYDGPPVLGGDILRTDYSGIGVSFGFGVAFGGHAVEREAGDREARVR